ncbi:MAG: ribonuclease H [Myxococcota bacterium]
MPWRKMKLRGATVYARCDASGALVDEGGRVEIRYKPKDGRAYAAGARNLSPAGDATVFPDAHCGEAEPVASKGKGATKGKKGGAKKAGKAAGPPPPEHPAPGEALAYCDGACSGNPGPAGLGVVLRYDDRERVLSEFLGRGTNNIAELTAILRACEGAPDLERPYRIYTDSTYSIGVLTKGWKAKANRELVAEVKDALAAFRDVQLHYVKGHAGVPLNEKADALAVAAVDARASAGWSDG